MSPLSDHTSIDTSDYGRRLAIVVSLVLHVVVLAGSAWYGYAKKDVVEERIMVQKVRLGGPPNMNLGGKQQKAPVAGRTPKPVPEKPKPKPEPKPKEVPPPLVKEKQVGLNKEKPVKKPPEPSPKKAPDNDERPSPIKPTEVKTPPEEDKEKINKAIGGLGGETGVALELGDGSPEVNLADLEFISFFKMVRARLTARWASKGLRGGQTTVRFRIDRQGKVSGVEIAKSSGRAYLDSPAKLAVLGVELPPLPQSYEGPELILNIVFNYDQK